MRVLLTLCLLTWIASQWWSFRAVVPVGPDEIALLRSDPTGWKMRAFPSGFPEAYNFSEQFELPTDIVLREGLFPFGDMFRWPSPPFALSHWMIFLVLLIAYMALKHVLESGTVEPREA